jgi:hypothetical protein
MGSYIALHDPIARRRILECSDGAQVATGVLHNECHVKNVFFCKRHVVGWRPGGMWGVLARRPWCQLLGDATTG